MARQLQNKLAVILPTKLRSSPYKKPASDLLYGWRFGNGLPRVLTFDNDGLLEKIVTPGLHSLGLEYHPAGEVAKIIDAVFPEFSSGYSYDKSSRLAQVERCTDAQTFQWDKAGNRTAHTRANEGGYIYTLDKTSNRLTNLSGAGKSRTFHYDAVGNVSGESGSDGERIYTYDSFNRMNGVLINGVHVGDYRINALSQRVYKLASGTSNASIYGPGGELLYEKGAINTSYVWLGAQLLGISRNGTFYASHNDQNARPEILPDADRSIVWREDNSAFGSRHAFNSIGGEYWWHK